MSYHFFIFGLGYSAMHLARHAIRHGWQVSGTTRDAKKREDLNHQGILAQEFEGAGIPAGVTHLLSSIPPNKHEVEPVLLRCQEKMRDIADLQWMGYLSTTGVYGDHQGEWVDEGTPVNPPNERLKRRVAAEQEWLECGVRRRVPTQVFRLAGIYGPGRSAVEQLQAGTARRIFKEGQVFSRTHVEDITQVLWQSMLHPTQGEVFNVCDDEPAPAHEVTSYAAELLGVEAPPLIPFEEAELSPMGREFYQSNRRVSNNKIKTMLGVTLAYPTYREGVAAIVNACTGMKHAP
jgi:nucleoside-diphosphate-sugar epimerase